MSNKLKAPRPENNDNRAYRGVAVVFFVAGVILMFSESTRASGVPFIVLGLTFFILSQTSKSPKK